LALAPPLPGDRFAVCAGPHAIASRAAQQQPVLLLVDDLHRLDARSRERVLYLARRPPEGVAILLALRDEAVHRMPPGPTVMSR
jgi:predicted ATPase